MISKRQVWQVALLIGWQAAFVTASAWCQETEPDKQLEEFDEKIDGFFDNLTDADSTATPEAAFRDLLAGTRLASEEDEAAMKAVRTLAAQTKEFETKYGAYVSHERIAAKRVGQDLVLLKYLYKAKEYPVVWHFTFYRSSRSSEADNWHVIAVRFDTRLELLAL